MTRLPQPGAILGFRRPLECAAAVLLGDGLHLLRLLGDPRLAAMELEEERRLFGKAFELRVADAGAHLDIVQKLDPRHRNAGLHRHDHGAGGAFEIGELAHRRRHRFGDAVKTQLDFGDDAERALRPDEQSREVVTRAGFARPPAGADDAPVAGDDGEPEHVFAHRAITDGIGSRRARGGHSADRCIRARVDREEEPGALELRVDLLARDAGLHAAVEVLGVDLQHAVHLRQIDAHAPGERGDVTLERRPHTKRDHGDARGVAKPNDRGDFVVGLREYDDIGKCCIRQSFAVAMPFADGARGHRALAIVGTEPADEIGEVAGVRAREASLCNRCHGSLRSAGCPDAGGCRDGRASCRIRRIDAAWARPCRD